MLISRENLAKIPQSTLILVTASASSTILQGNLGKTKNINSSYLTATSATMTYNKPPEGTKGR
jgi:hypothetical protein